jgi:type VI secretion system protein ImpB
MPESIHEKLKRVRKPHVHITMDIDGEGLPVHELPFVVGVMGDFVGDPDPDDPPKPLSERKFIEIDRDKFNDVMARLKPRLELKVPDTISGDKDAEFKVELGFQSLSDFHPDQLVQNVPALKKLLDARTKLEQLASAAEKGKGAEQVLEQILQSTEQLDRLKNEVSQGGANEGAQDGRETAEGGDES